jgi:hypothetical protein
MRRIAGVLALSTLCLATACSPKGAPVRVAALTPDPAQLTGCQRAFPAFPKLTPFVVFTLVAPVEVTLADGSGRTLAAGTELVSYDVALDRDEQTARFIVGPARGAWSSCETRVVYVEDWAAKVKAGLIKAGQMAVTP